MISMMVGLRDSNTSCRTNAAMSVIAHIAGMITITAMIVMPNDIKNIITMIVITSMVSIAMIMIVTDMVIGMAISTVITEIIMRMTVMVISTVITAITCIISADTI